MCIKNIAPVDGPVAWKLIRLDEMNACASSCYFVATISVVVAPDDVVAPNCIAARWLAGEISWLFE